MREADDRLREKEAELDQCGRERDAERQRARELEGQIRRLQPIIQEKEREIQVWVGWVGGLGLGLKLGSGLGLKLTRAKVRTKARAKVRSGLGLN